MFVLIHAPLVGPLTWSLVADELRRQGIEAAVPTLASPEHSLQAYWRSHVSAVLQAIDIRPASTTLILVGHSGAGMLLPAVRQMINRPVESYIFVDSGIPENGKSRLDMFESAQAAEDFRRTAVDGYLPVWTDGDLREVIPDTALRQRFVAELRPLPLKVYEEALPVFEGWPDAPVGFVRFGDNPAYDSSAQRARREGWPLAELDGRHFHMLVNPFEVAQALVSMARRLSAG